MPTRKKTKAKKSKTTMKKKKRVVAKKKMKTMKGAKPRRSRPTVAKRMKTMKPMARKMTKAPKAAGPAPLGKVVHYYDRIGVAIVELEKPMSVGDMVMFKRGIKELTQKITSMQINHLAVPNGKKGDVVGVQVSQEVQKGALVTPA